MLFACFISAHSPDNTFLGFVVENHISPAEELKKKNIALVYGKHVNMWQVRTNALSFEDASVVRSE